ncbi:MAG: hypothetical protein IPK00_25050 [Deltaproteobacteria bacterium]|nr:hypothetical protein [Deltaproteobacteria bacterium]
MTSGSMLREAIRAGSLAGLAMIPVAAIFRARGLRVNEYGRKTLELLVGDVAPALHFSLTFVQHLVISVLAALPLILVFERFFGASGERRTRILVGAAYGAGFYVVMNSLALPLAFGDPTPWALGFETVYPSLAIHLIYGAVLGWAVRPGNRGERS